MDLLQETQRRILANESAFKEGKTSLNFYSINKEYYEGIIANLKAQEEDIIPKASKEFTERLKMELSDFNLEIYLIGGFPFIANRKKVSEIFRK